MADLLVGCALLQLEIAFKILPKIPSTKYFPCQTESKFWMRTTVVTQKSSENYEARVEFINGLFKQFMNEELFTLEQYETVAVKLTSGELERDAVSNASQ